MELLKTRKLIEISNYIAIYSNIAYLRIMNVSNEAFKYFNAW